MHALVKSQRLALVQPGQTVPHPFNDDITGLDPQDATRLLSISLREWCRRCVHERRGYGEGNEFSCWRHPVCIVCGKIGHAITSPECAFEMMRCSLLTQMARKTLSDAHPDPDPDSELGRGHGESTLHLPVQACEDGTQTNDDKNYNYNTGSDPWDQATVIEISDDELPEREWAGESIPQLQARLAVLRRDELKMRIMEFKRRELLARKRYLLLKHDREALEVDLEAMRHSEEADGGGEGV